jgi:hypothetical protein
LLFGAPARCFAAPPGSAAYAGPAGFVGLVQGGWLVATCTPVAAPLVQRLHEGINRMVAELVGKGGKDGGPATGGTGEAVEFVSAIGELLEREQGLTGPTAEELHERQSKQRAFLEEQLLIQAQAAQIKIAQKPEAISAGEQWLEKQQWMGQQQQPQQQPPPQQQQQHAPPQQQQQQHAQQQWLEQQQQQWLQQQQWQQQQWQQQQQQQQSGQQQQQQYR